MYAYCNNNPVMFSDPLGEMVTYSGITYDGVEFHNVPAHQLGWYGQIKEYTIDSVIYDVPLYNQGELNICWAYCQAMIEDYKSNVERKRFYVDGYAIRLAFRRRGAFWNKGGRPKNIDILYTPQNGIYHMFLMLKSHGPLYASYGYCDEKNNLSGHAVVITGIDLYRNIVYTNNPWGIRGEQTYNDFLKGPAGVISKPNTSWSLRGYNCICGGNGPC